MPARSQAQRAYLAVHFGPSWMHKHGFANKGPLPARVPKRKTKKSPRRHLYEKAVRG